MTAQRKSRAAAGSEFVISRVFDAPRELVWKAFTEADRMKEWWGPKGSTISIVKLDLRPGGFCHYRMTAANGTAMWGKFLYREIEPLARIVGLTTFSDEAGGLTRHPMVPTWPREMLSIFTFEEQPGGKTKLTIRWSPHNATEEELQAFEAGRDGMRMGWTGSLDQLTAYLERSN